METRLGFVVLFKYFQQEGGFPKSVEDVPSSVVKFIANQIQTSTEQLNDTAPRFVSILAFVNIQPMISERFPNS
ncbi:MAG: DUF4158 domain-containing protein [Thermoactinomyces sp.]